MTSGQDVLGGIACKTPELQELCFLHAEETGLCPQLPVFTPLHAAGKRMGALDGGGAPENQGRTGGGKHTGHPMHQTGALHRLVVYWVTLRLCLHTSMQNGVSPKFTC